MFKNSNRDPLAVPDRTRRTSAAPINNGPMYRDTYGGDPNRDPRADEPHDGRFEHSRTQEWPPGSGRGWMPGNGIDAPTHLHPVHGPYSPNPREYPGPHPTNILDKPVKREMGAPMTFATSPVTASIPPRVAAVLDTQARVFMEREGNTTDRSELLYRARRHAEVLTSTWSRTASQRVAEAFCARVDGLAPRRTRTAARSAQPVADFDDQLFYL